MPSTIATSADVTHIARILHRAINCVFAYDSLLLQQDTSEWAIAHRLAVYLEQQLPGWNIDCEYNRQGAIEDPKKADDGEKIRPDIIVHHRQQLSSEHNLLVLELKKNANDADLGKARSYTAARTDKRPYQYKYGVALSFLPELRTTWYFDGREIKPPI